MRRSSRRNKKNDEKNSSNECLTKGVLYIGLKILSIAELGFFLVMLYGYVTHTNPSKQKALAINIIISGLSALLCFFLFAGYLTIIETISSVSFIWGGYLLTTSRRWLGWVLFIVAHISTSIVSFHAQQTIFASLQIVSAVVCIYALFVRRPIKPLPSQVLGEL
jgi:signal transduction histidine kinase